MQTSAKSRWQLVRLIATYLLISVAALWLAEGDAATTPSFIYQAF